MKISFTVMNGYTEPAVIDHIKTHPAWPRRLWDPETGKRMSANALELAALADELGYDYVSVSEHHYAGFMTNPNPAVLAAALTQVVKRAGIALLGPLASMNNPVRIAEEFAMIDQLSGGRLLTMPLRGTPNEYPMYNVDAAETVGRTREAMLLIRKALSEPEPFAWKGEYYDFPIVSVWPGPTQVPHPPMISSANSEESAIFAAENRFGAACSYFGPLRVAELMKLYRDTAAKAGWTPTDDQMLFRAFAICGDDAEHARDLESRFEGVAAQDVQQAEWLPENAQNAGFAFGLLQFKGDPDALVDQIREFHELTGVGLLDLSFSFGYFSLEETKRQLRTFAKEVLPRVREFSKATAA